MKQITIGLLAHVDAGKTTLSEGMLYESGSIRTLGRVDNQDAFLDTDAMERKRGITIFSKQARLKWKEMCITLLDTPGHVDFSAEMERTLQVLDYAVLIINGVDKVQSHTKTLWKLLERYHIPTFLFVNKMDQVAQLEEHGEVAILRELKEKLSDKIISFQDTATKEFYEEIAMEGEQALEHYMEEEVVPVSLIQAMIAKREVFPCCFGAALRLEGVATLLDLLSTYGKERSYEDTFAAKVFKIDRDEKGNRLTFMKITGGTLTVKELLKGKEWEEKVNEIRLYSGEKYESVKEVEAGSVCAVTGLTKTFPGEGLGVEKNREFYLEPVLTYQVLLPEGISEISMLPKLMKLEEQEPMLRVHYDELHKELKVAVMGQVQLEVLKGMIATEFGIEVEFGAGNILYKETIANVVEGVGHFEPLRHYAEVHLIIEPMPQGTGLIFATDCSEDMLNKNWQRLIIAHLKEKQHLGTVIGAPITDMKLTLVAGRAHQKHTEGGDFREATYRAVRNGLKQAEGRILEPFYEYQLTVPEAVIGKVMTDMEKMSGTCELLGTENGMGSLNGECPVATMREYQQEVLSYTKGQGSLSLQMKGYGPCHNEEEIKEKFHYDSEADVNNPTGSIFCKQGAGYYVSWEQVKDHMHIESQLTLAAETKNREQEAIKTRKQSLEDSIDLEEIDAILSRTFYANQGNKTGKKRRGVTRRAEDYVAPVKVSVKKENKPKYLLVDGYNVIFAWEELKKLAKESLDGARGRLLDVLCDYQGMTSCHLIAVFDAYKVDTGESRIEQHHNIHVVYTKKGETADQYIEKFAHTYKNKYDITVATSDRLEQLTTSAQDARIISARELKEQIMLEKDRLKETYLRESKESDVSVKAAMEKITAELREVLNNQES